MCSNVLGLSGIGVLVDYMFLVVFTCVICFICVCKFPDAFVCFGIGFGRTIGLW